MSATARCWAVLLFQRQRDMPNEDEEQIEYVVLFNPNYPLDHELRPHGVYLDDWAAARKVMDLLNEYYPGKWEPENLMSNSLRFVSTEARGSLGLIAYVDRRPAQLLVLQQSRKRCEDDLTYHREQTEKIGLKIRLIESQIKALKREVTL